MFPPQEEFAATYVGGDLEVHVINPGKGRTVYRGPITRITVEDGDAGDQVLVIEQDWRAETNVPDGSSLPDGPYSYCDNEPFRLSSLLCSWAKPDDMGRYQINAPMADQHVLITLPGSNLDPSNVEAAVS